MLSFFSFTRLQIASATLAIALLSACGGGGGGGAASVPPVPLGAAPSTDLSDSAAQQTQSSLTQAASDLTTADAIDAGRPLGSGARSTQATNPCVSASPQPPVINVDGIPANETYTLANCTRSTDRGTETLNGSFNVTDNSQPGGPLTWTRTVPNMTVTLAKSDGTTAIDARNGSGVHTLVTPTQETIVRNFTNNWNQGQSNAWTGVNSENITFTSSAGNIVPLQNPPSGLIALTGTHQVTRGSTTVSYTMATQGSGLTYDSTCQTLPRITAGSLVLTPSQQGQKTITITWTACGQPPTITKS